MALNDEQLRVIIKAVDEISDTLNKVSRNHKQTTDKMTRDNEKHNKSTKDLLVTYAKWAAGIAILFVAARKLSNVIQEITRRGTAQIASINTLRAAVEQLGLDYGKLGDEIERTVAAIELSGTAVDTTVRSAYSILLTILQDLGDEQEVFALATEAVHVAQINAQVSGQGLLEVSKQLGQVLVGNVTTYEALGLKMENTNAHTLAFLDKNIQLQSILTETEEGLQIVTAAAIDTGVGFGIAAIAGQGLSVTLDPLKLLASLFSGDLLANAKAFFEQIKRLTGFGAELAGIDKLIKAIGQLTNAFSVGFVEGLDKALKSAGTDLQQFTKTVHDLGKTTGEVLASIANQFERILKLVKQVQSPGETFGAFSGGLSGQGNVMPSEELLEEMGIPELRPTPIVPDKDLLEPKLDEVKELHALFSSDVMDSMGEIETANDDLLASFLETFEGIAALVGDSTAATIDNLKQLIDVAIEAIDFVSELISSDGGGGDGIGIPTDGGGTATGTTQGGTVNEGDSGADGLLAITDEEGDIDLMALIIRAFLAWLTQGFSEGFFAASGGGGGGGDEGGGGGLGSVVSLEHGVTNNPVSRMAWVGEGGRELMHVPQGASIIPNRESEQIAAGAGGQNTYYGPVVFRMGGDHNLGMSGNESRDLAALTSR